MVCLPEPSPGQLEPGVVQENRIVKNKHRIWELGPHGAVRILLLAAGSNHESNRENFNDDLGPLTAGSGRASWHGWWALEK